MAKQMFDKAGSVEYCMPKKMAEELARLSGKSKKTLNLQEYLIDYVNAELGLLNTCTKVTLI